MNTIKVNPDGSIEVSTIAQALELQHAIALQAAKVKPVTPKAANVNGSARTTEALTSGRAEEITAGLSDWVVPNAIAFLTTIAEARPSVASADSMMAAMGINDPKAFGGRSAAINKLLQKAGFNPDHVYETTKTKTGRIWKGRAKLDEALARMKALALV